MYDTGLDESGVGRAVRDSILAIPALAVMGVVGVMLWTPPAQADAQIHPEPETFCTASVPDGVPEEDEVSVPFDVPLSIFLQEYVVECCAESEPEIPAEIVVAIMEHESGFRPDAVGCNADGTRDYGLMQINDRAVPQLREDLGIREAEDLLDPRTNIRSGVHILRLHTAAFPDSIESVLMAYQCGESGALDKLEAGISETGFSREVMERAEELKEVIS